MDTMEDNREMKELFDHNILQMFRIKNQIKKKDLTPGLKKELTSDKEDGLEPKCYEMITADRELHTQILRSTKFP